MSPEVSVVEVYAFEAGVADERASAAPFREAAALVVGTRREYPADSIAMSIAIEALERALLREHQRINRDQNR